MSVEQINQGWLKHFMQMRKPAGAMQALFTMKDGGTYYGEKVSIDIERTGEDVAVAVKRFTGPNLNDFDEYTTKTFTPPTYNEGFPLDVAELVNRMAGMNPFDSAYTGYAAQFMNRVVKGFTKMDYKIQRAVELQASQVLQTGKLSLTDFDDDVVFDLDFQPKASHFPTAAVAWSDPTADIEGDLLPLFREVRANGQVKPKKIILGELSIEAFLNNEGIKGKLDNRRIETGHISPDVSDMEDAGFTYYGDIVIGTYKLDIYTYDATYKHPSTGAVTNFLNDESCIVLGKDIRLDKVCAIVPLPLGPDPRVESLMPGELKTTSGGGIALTPNLYSSTNGKQLIGELETRPLLVPVQIDGFGCLNTGVTA